VLGIEEGAASREACHARARHLRRYHRPSAPPTWTAPDRPPPGAYGTVPGDGAPVRCSTARKGTPSVWRWVRGARRNRRLL